MKKLLILVFLLITIGCTRQTMMQNTQPTQNDKLYRQALLSVKQQDEMCIVKGIKIFIVKCNNLPPIDQDKESIK
jgi:hypothetical protein